MMLLQPVRNKKKIIKMNFASQVFCCFFVHFFFRGLIVPVKWLILVYAERVKLYFAQSHRNIVKQKWNSRWRETSKMQNYSTILLLTKIPIKKLTAKKNTSLTMCILMRLPNSSANFAENYKNSMQNVLQKRRRLQKKEWNFIPLSLSLSTCRSYNNCIISYYHIT